MEEEKANASSESGAKMEYPLEVVKHENLKCIDIKDWCFYFTNEKITHSK